MSYKDFFVPDPDNPNPKRRPARMKDQHKRRWFAEIDTKSGFPIGLVRLQHRTPAGHKPPWEPDQTALKYTADNPFRLTIDYQELLTSRLAAHEEYHRAAVELAVSKGWPIPVKGERYPDNVVLVVGHPPKPWQPIKAAMDGNQWILGFTDVVDPRLKDFVLKATRVEKLMADLPSFADAAPTRPAVEPDADADDDDETGFMGGEADGDIAEEMLAAQVEELRAKGARNTKGQFAAKGG